ncbi:hypothetical protein Pla144_41450 [Bythopirellula polymerisocia]|uniref:Sulfatase n=2 Tax=Bythopirellula polymerisocia TaxID=2528003 RepID=A0A5C6CFA4_9BACT|nr:hypothetical protein Pla144_41450 [Bythopirellula polymerisocia]
MTFVSAHACLVLLASAALSAPGTETSPYIVLIVADDLEDEEGNRCHG